jgi:predicted DNA-binding transcriptional regulator AlpA
MKENLPRVIRWPGLRKMFDDNISKSTIARWEKDKRFPARVRLGENSVAWNLAEVEQWFQERSNAVIGVK